MDRRVSAVAKTRSDARLSRQISCSSWRHLQDAVTFSNGWQKKDSLLQQQILQKNVWQKLIHFVSRSNVILWWSFLNTEKVSILRNSFFFLFLFLLDRTSWTTNIRRKLRGRHIDLVASIDFFIPDICTEYSQLSSAIKHLDFLLLEGVYAALWCCLDVSDSANDELHSHRNCVENIFPLL